MSNTETKEVKDVYTIIKNGEQAFWQKIGRAHVNKDGSLNVYLACRIRHARYYAESRIMPSWPVILPQLRRRLRFLTFPNAA